VGKSYEPIPEAVSGMVHFVLAQRGSRAFAKLVEVAVEILAHSVEIEDGGWLPDEDSAVCEVRDRLLNLCLPDTVAGKIRMLRLQVYITSDIREDRAIFYNSGPRVTPRGWAKRVCRDLLPAPLPMFRRQRWLTSLEPVKETCLVAGTFNLLHRAVPRWLVSLQGKVPGPIEAPPQDLLALEDDIEPEQQRWQPDNVGEAINWQVFNEVQRRGSAKFAGNPRIMAELHASIPGLINLSTLFDDLLKGDSDRHEEKVLKDFAEKGAASDLRHRGEDAYSGRLTLEYFERAAFLLLESGAWLTLPVSQLSVSLRSKIYACLTRAMGAINHIIHHPRKGFPTKLLGAFAATDEFLDEMLRSCPHLRDLMVANFLEKFDTVEKLKGDDAQCVLYMMLVLFSRTSADVESLWAAIRRSVRVSDATWAPMFNAISSKWLIMRQRGVERESWATKVVHEKAQVGRKRKEYSGGGGAQRAMVSKVLRERYASGELDNRRLNAGDPSELQRRQQALRDAAARLKEAREEGGQLWEDLCRQGRAATASKQLGGVGFSGRSKRPSITSAPQATPPSADALAIVGQELALHVDPESRLDEAIVAVRAEESAMVAARNQVEDNTVEILQSWAQKAADDAKEVVGELAFLKGLGAHHEPGKFRGIHTMTVIPPLLKMAEHGLAVDAGVWHKPLTASLRKQWDELCRPIKHAETDPIQGRLEPNSSACFIAGRCLCDARGIRVQQVADAFVRVMRNALAKGEPGQTFLFGWPRAQGEPMAP